MSASADAVPMLDLSIVGEGEWDAVQRVVRSGHYILGEEVSAFEEELAGYLGVKHAVGVSSGSDALVIGLRALGVRPGDEVVTTAYTFVATAEAIVRVGAQPVFVDIDPGTLNIDPDAVEAAITERTRAVVPVHLFGRAADMERLRELADRRELRVLEDAAQAAGGRGAQGRVGGLGHAAAFSFFPTKNLASMGDGGCITTHDDDVAALARSLRQHGAPQRKVSEHVGYNARLDAIQAAILRVRLQDLSARNDARRALAMRYREGLAGLDGVETPADEPGHVYHLYALRVPSGWRPTLQARLSRAGVASRVYYDPPLHRTELYAELGRVGSAGMAETERASDEMLCVPIWPTMTHAQQDRVIDALRAAHGALSART